MNQRELGELRRRFRPEKSAISRIYGCYVNSSREIIAYIDQSLGMTTQEETEKYLGLLKKALSGTLGRNLIDIVFSTQQVADSEEHRLLSALRNSELKDAEAREAFYQRVIQSLDMGESNYLILLGSDAYDVPHRGRDGEVDRDAGEEVFRYLVCSICPVKDGTPELGYFSRRERVPHLRGEADRGASRSWASCSPPLTTGRPTSTTPCSTAGSRTPSTRSSSTRCSARSRPCPPPSSGRPSSPPCAGALEEDCSMEVVQSVHDYLRQRIQEHKDSRDPEPLAVTAGEVGGVLRNCGVPEERVEAFQAACGESFGEGALAPANLIDARHFAVKTADATIQVDPERSYLVEARIIDGRRYLLVPADESVEVNGLGVRIAAQAGGETAEGEP